MALVYRHIRLDTNDVFYIGIELNSNFSETTIRRFLNNKYPNKTNLKYLKDYEFTRI